MSKEVAVQLIWEGETSLARLRELVQARIAFELQLPPDYHYALFCHLYPDAPAGAQERIDVSGGADLIGKVAEIQGLQELAALAAAVSAARAQVRIQSPGPGILVRFSSTETA